MTDDEHDKQVRAMYARIIKTAEHLKAAYQAGGTEAFANFLTAWAMATADVIYYTPDATKAMVLLTIAKEARMRVEVAKAPAPTDATQPRKRSNAPSRTEARAAVIAHTLTLTEFRYGNRNKDAQTVRDLYRGQGHKRVDVYSPDGDLLQSVEVEP